MGGNICEHDALILFDPGSTHNFISQELALKLRIHDFEMGEEILVDGAFKGQKVNVTPFIEKLHYTCKAMWTKKISTSPLISMKT